MACPDPECRESMQKFQDDIKKTLFGINGRGGITGCMGKFITRRQIWLFITMLMVPILLGSWKVAADYIFTTKNEANYIIANMKENVTDNDKRISKVEDEMQHILSTQKQVLSTIKEMQKEREKYTKDVIDELKRLGTKIDSLEREDTTEGTTEGKNITSP